MAQNTPGPRGKIWGSPRSKALSLVEAMPPVGQSSNEAWQLLPSFDTHLSLGQKQPALHTCDHSISGQPLACLLVRSALFLTLAVSHARPPASARGL